MYRPSAEVVCTEVTRGAWPSTTMLTEPDELNTPLEFENEPESTSTLAVPENPLAGVNVAVYVVPEPLKADIDPPVTITSDASKSVDDAPNVMVSAVVRPMPVDVGELAMVTAGLLLSSVYVCDVLALVLTNELPARSEILGDVASAMPTAPLYPAKSPPEMVTS